MLGSSNRSPDPEEVLLLEKPQQSVVINLLGIALEDRPAFFNRLLPRLQELRARTGHPHWIVVDETHHLLPAALEPGSPVATEYVRDDDAYCATPACGKRCIGPSRCDYYHWGSTPRDIAPFQRNARLALLRLWHKRWNRAMLYCGQGTRQLPLCSSAPCPHGSNASGMCANIWKVIWARK